MTLLDLSGVGNSIGDTGGNALMNCLDKIKKLKINEDKISTKVKEKIIEQARDLSVTVLFFET